MPRLRHSEDRDVKYRASANPTSLAVRNLVIDGRRTSVRLDAVLWDAFCDIAHRRNLSLHDLATEIDQERTLEGLTAAIRSYIVAFYRKMSVKSVNVPNKKLDDQAKYIHV